MTTAYVLGQNPFWNPNDLLAEPFIDGTMKSLRDVARSQQKSVYQDPGGLIPYPDPVQFDGSGTAGPFYFADDEAYYLEFYDRHENLVRTIEHYTPGTGGGSPVNNYIDFDNKLINGQFRFFETNNASLQGITFTSLGPFWYFWKNITGAGDSIQFNRFTLGQTDVEANPVYYCRYICNSVQLGETFKYIYNQVNDVNAFENREITIQFQSLSPLLNTVELYFIQYFGTGGAPSATVVTPVESFTLTSTYNKYYATFTVPTTGGKTIGLNGDDAVYIAIGLPLSAISDISIANVQLNIGNIILPYYFRTEEMEEPLVQPAENNVIPVGTPIIWLTSIAPPGFLLCDGNSYDAYINNRIYYNLSKTLGGFCGFGNDGFVSAYNALASNYLYVMNTNNSSGISLPSDVSSGLTFSTLRTGGSSPTAYQILFDYPYFYTPNFQINTLLNFSQLTIGTMPYISFTSIPYENYSVTPYGTISAKFYIDFASFPTGPIAAGNYFTIPSGSTGPIVVWYKVNGVGSAPSVPGAVLYIEVDILSSETQREWALKTTSAIGGYQSFSITVPALPSGGSYFLASTQSSNYTFYFIVNNVGIDPAISGRKSIPIYINNSMTLNQIASSISYYMSLIQFNTPNFTDAFLRGPTGGAAGGDRWRPGYGTGLQVDMFASHTHALSNFIPPYAGFVGQSGLDTPAFGSIGSNITLATGGAETRPRNILVNYAIKY